MFLLFLLFFQFTFAGSICNDGTYSESEGRGTCSWHGGVEKKYDYNIPQVKYQEHILLEERTDTIVEISPYVEEKWESSSDSSLSLFEADIATYYFGHRGAISYICDHNTKYDLLLFRYDNDYRYKINTRITPEEAKKEGINLNVKFEFTTSDGQVWEYPMEDAVVLFGEEQLEADEYTWTIGIKVGPKLIAQLKDSTSISVSVLGDGFTVNYSKLNAWIAIDTANRLCLRN